MFGANKVGFFCSKEDDIIILVKKARVKCEKKGEKKEKAKRRIKKTKEKNKKAEATIEKKKKQRKRNCPEKKKRISAC